MAQTRSAARPPARTAKRRAGAPAGPRRADARRAALIDAAGRLFVEKGVQAATMEEIAVAAGVAKGTLYHYFASKAALLTALQNSFVDEVTGRLEANMGACAAGDWKARLKAWIDTAVEAYLGMRALHDVVFYGAEMPRRYAMADADISRCLARLLRDGAKAGAWRVEDERWTAVIMFYAFRGGCDEAIMGTHSALDVSEKLYSLFLRMLRAHD